MDLGMRRIVLVILSIVGGIGLTLGILSLLDFAYNNVTLERYGTVYAVLTAIPLAVLVGIWLDLFMGTRLLSDGPAEGAEAKPSRSAKSEE
jgi:hypothetical protein